MYGRFLCAGALAIASLIAVAVHDASYGKSKMTLVHDKALPNVPGKSIRTVLVEYGPGGFSPAYAYPSSAFLYATVLQGSIRAQVDGGPVLTYRAGQSFSEPPGDRHGVSENASATEPARLLAVFVLDSDATRPTTPTGAAGQEIDPDLCAARAATEASSQGDWTPWTE